MSTIFALYIHNNVICIVYEYSHTYVCTYPFYLTHINILHIHFFLYIQATGALRKEQEEESLLFQRLADNRLILQETETKYNETNQRLVQLKSEGIQNLTPEQLLTKLQKDVKDIYERKEPLLHLLSEREAHLDKLQGWDNSDRITTDDDVQVKREQVRHIEEEVSNLQQRLDISLSQNSKLLVFRQASVMAQKKLREKEVEVEKLLEEKRKIIRIITEKESLYDQKTINFNKNKLNIKDKAKLVQTLQEKNETYKHARDNMSKLRAELVILQRTQQVVIAQYMNTGGTQGGDRRKLDQMLEEAEKKRLSNVSHIHMFITSLLLTPFLPTLPLSTSLASYTYANYSLVYSYLYMM